MKKFLTISLLCLVVTFASAQKPEEGDMGLTFGFNGLSILGGSTNFGTGTTLLFRNYIRDDMAIRSRLNLTIDRFSTETSDTSGNSTEDITKNHSASINLGLQKCFAQNMKRIEPYITGEVVFGLGKNGIMENSSTAGTFSFLSETDPGTTITLGLLSHVGFNYFFTDHFAFGIEFGYGLLFSSTGAGTITTTTTESGVSTTTTTSTASNKSFALSGTGGEALVMISIFFNHQMQR